MKKYVLFLLMAPLVAPPVHAAAVATAHATIDISSLHVAGGTFKFGFIPIVNWDTNAWASDGLGTEAGDSRMFGASTAATGPNTAASADFDGTLLFADASADAFSATSAARLFTGYTVTYDEFGTGGTITATIDYTMTLDDPVLASPTFPVADVFGVAQLDIWTFHGESQLVSSSSNSGDIFVGTARPGAPLDVSGTLVASIDLPAMAPGTVVVFAAEPTIQVGATGFAPVPVPASVLLMLSAITGLGFVGRKRV